MPSPKYKGRRVELICPSAGQLKRYQELAEKAGTPLSKYLLNAIEKGLDERGFSEISQGIRDLKQENHELREQLRTQSLLAKKFESEVRKLQQAVFLDDNFVGERDIEPRLVAVLKRGQIHDYRLLEVLDVDPKDQDQVKAVYRQLEVLELHGIISKNSNGWRWLK